VQSAAKRGLDWRALRQAAVRRIGRFLFPDPRRRARVGSALAKCVHSILTLGGRRVRIGVAIDQLLRRSRPPCRLEIDRSRVLQEMPLWALLNGPCEGFAIAEPEILVTVKQHPLSVPSSNPAEASTYLDHQFHAREMTLERLRDHYWFPESGFLISRGGKVWRNSVLGQYGDRDFLTTQAVERRGGELLFHDCLLRGCPVIEETAAITSHFGSGNYGHFMLDMVPLIRKLSAIGVPLVSRPLLDWHRSIYRSLGVDPSDVRIVTDRVVMLRDCVVSNRHNAEGTYAASPQTREVFEAVLGNVLARRAGAAAKRIFVARTTNNLKREMRNRQQLADALAGRGFTVVHPETLPFDVQAAIFAGADVIVAEFGAAMVNVVFASPGTEVVEIIPDDQDDPWSAHLCASLGLEHITLFQRVDEADRIACEAGGRVLRNVFFAYDADIERICRVVDSIRPHSKSE